MGVLKIRDGRIILLEGEAWMRRGAKEREMKKGKKYLFPQGTNLKTEGNLSLQHSDTHIGVLRTSGNSVQVNRFN